MSRRSRKGYYVNGEFVPTGSAADQQLRAELEGDNPPSRSELKEASAKLQKLGEALLTLRQDMFLALPLPDRLREAILEARRLASPEALRRQKQFIGKLMRQLDDETLEAAASALRRQHVEQAADSARLHRAEQWRDALLADDDRLVRWINEFPATDSQHLRTLIRQARKDAVKTRPGEARRQGRAYREIFTLLREQLDNQDSAPPGS